MYKLETTLLSLSLSSLIERERVYLIDSIPNKRKRRRKRLVTFLHFP